MSSKICFRHPVLFSNFWALCLVFTVAFLLASASYADETADIARLLELGDAYQEAGKQFRAKKITKKKLQEHRKAIQQESRKINNRYGKKGSPNRVAWDKKVLAAKNQHKKDKRLAVQAANAKASAEAQAKRMEKKKKVVEEATATNALKQAELMKITKEYSQVHLPEEALIPMKTTDVQGVQYGMLQPDAEKILKDHGYQLSGRLWVLDDGQSQRTIEVGFEDLYLTSGDDKRHASVIRYRQRFRQEIKFDTEAIKQALIEKYGQPTNLWMHPINGAGLQFQPSQPAYNVQAACTEEMQRRGTAPDSRKAEIHPMEYKAWQERGERDVKQRCPDQLNGYRQYMHFKLGIWASITANPNTKEIAIEWKDEGTKPRMFRKMKEEQFLKVDSGPEATPSL